MAEQASEQASEQSPARAGLGPEPSSPYWDEEDYFPPPAQAEPAPEQAPDWGWSDADQLGEAELRGELTELRGRFERQAQDADQWRKKYEAMRDSYQRLATVLQSAPEFLAVSSPFDMPPPPLAMKRAGRKQGTGGDGGG
mmetsp:Transcript_5211/g.11463  ORF Transcript_5211/g.11463 Transcript_5211/m.11463 type:complete len:140 (+) Transcript_5211:28-447(+)